MNHYDTHIETLVDAHLEISARRPGQYYFAQTVIEWLIGAGQYHVQLLEEKVTSKSGTPKQLKAARFVKVETVILRTFQGKLNCVNFCRKGCKDEATAGLVITTCALAVERNVSLVLVVMPHFESKPGHVNSGLKPMNALYGTSVRVSGQKLAVQIKDSCKEHNTAYSHSLIGFVEDAIPQVGLIARCVNRLLLSAYSSNRRSLWTFTILD